MEIGVLQISLREDEVVLGQAGPWSETVSMGGSPDTDTAGRQP